MKLYEGKLTVVPDKTTPGSSGRLCLQLPEDFGTQVGMQYRQVGTFGVDGAAMFIRSVDGSTITPRRQMWWKNGVRDQRLRQGWKVNIFVLEDALFVVTLVSPIGERLKLPSIQQLLFVE